jgi:hypothetical protein
VPHESSWLLRECAAAPRPGSDAARIDIGTLGNNGSGKSQA